MLSRSDLMKYNYDQLLHFPRGITDHIESPSFVVNERVLESNARIIADVRKKTGAKVLLALKAFAMHSSFPVLRKYLDGISASGPIEARLGYEKFRREVVTYAPAYSDSDIKEVARYSDKVVFNSIAQLRKYRAQLLRAKKGIEIGLRVNPGISGVKNALYNPTLPGSRLGIQPSELNRSNAKLLDGLHFHALCEQNADALVHVLKQFENRYGRYLSSMKWVNFGGGHHITRADYDRKLLIDTINAFKEKYGVQVYLEPGEAVALNAGALVTTVLDVVHNGVDIAILDTSAEAHMPDVLAGPYRPEIIGAGKPGEQKYTYRLGGLTCLAGDVIGDYSFSKKLKPGDRLVFLDMAHYSMVKTTTFNGVKHPSIVLYNPDIKRARTIRRFGYADYRDRLS